MPLLAAALAPLAASVAVAAPATGTAFAPRPISAAERAAVEMVLVHAVNGPAALWDLLAEDSPLRALGRERALGEIAARLGPVAGSSWRLSTPDAGEPEGRTLFAVEFASGIDDTVILDLVRSGSAWRLREVRCLVDPPRPEDGGPNGGSGGVGAAASAETRGGGAVAWALLAASALFAVSLAPRRRLAGAGLAVGAALSSALACARGGGPEAAAVVEPPALAELEPLRRALAHGTDEATIARELARVPADDRLIRIRDLWHAQLELVGGDVGEAERLLGPAVESGPESWGLPLERLLRARIARERLDPGTGPLYDRVIEALPAHDAVRYEALAAKALTEAESAGLAVEARLLVETGSRSAEPWYAAAIDAAILDRDEESEELLRVGWQLRPRPRDELLDDPALTFVVARPRVFPLLGLDSPDEPRVEAGPGASALSPPAGVEASLCGSELRLDSGELELLIPGGAALAPAGVAAESAGERDRRLGDRGLAARPAMRAAAARGGGLGPRLNRLAEAAADLLARERRWSELLTLTDGLAAHAGVASRQLIRLRALALDRTGRRDEALELLVALAERELGAKRPAPGLLFDLADAFAARGDYERAIRLVERADSRLPAPRGELRLRVFRMSRDLEAEARVHRSEHFDIRYPRATGERYARQLATVFESERDRLLRWIPRPGDRRLVIELFPLERFIQSYGGMAIGVTLADGPVRLPFADLRSLHPELIEILSHELAHAMIDGATAGRAPRWFHEGLAQHVEMGIGPVNPLPELVKEGRNLSVPAIEPVIAGFSDPELVDIAYAESAWVVAFLEERWGLSALHRMQALFAGDHDTESALAAVTGSSMAEFDSAFRRWALSGQPSPRSLPVRRFDLELDSPLAAEPRRADLPRVAARPPAAPAAPPAPSGVGRAEMAGWHRIYAARAAPVKAAFAPVLEAFRSGGTPPAPRECARLANEADRLLGDRDALVAPDDVVASALAELYRDLSALGSSCREGRHDEARRRYDASLGQLERATSALARYGLRP